MNENVNKNQFFYTSNFYCSVFCYIKGLQLVDIDRSNPNRAQFIFIDAPEREKIVRKFNFSERNSPDVMVDAREFEATVKLFKDRLYQGEGKL